jgi:hypothetical protein
MKNNLVIALFIFLIGIIVGRVTAPVEDLNLHFKEKIIQLNNEEMKNYANASDADSKLKAAQALYEKIVILFLADLSLNIAHYENKMVTTSEDKTQSALNKDLDVSYESESGKFVNTSTTNLTETASASSEKEAEVKKLNENSNPEEVLYQYLKAKPAKKIDKNIEKFIGSMTGTLKYLDGKFKNEIHTLYMEMNFTITDKDLQGNSLIELRDANDHPYSTSRGDGGNNSLKISENNPNYLYVEVSPDSFFMIDLKSYPNFSGSYFKRDKKIGYIQLKKSAP